MCVAAFNAFYDLREKLKAAPTRYKKLRGMVKALRHDPVLQNHRDFFSSRDLRVALTGDDPEDFWTVMENALDVDVFNTVWSNGYGIIVLRYCDVCGETCIDDQRYTDEVWFAIEEEFKSYESFVYRNKKAMERLINQWGVPATVAKAESEKTVTELIDHLEECSLEHAPLIFDQCRSSSSGRSGCLGFRGGGRSRLEKTAFYNRNCRLIGRLAPPHDLAGTHRIGVGLRDSSFKNMIACPRGIE